VIDLTARSISLFVSREYDSSNGLNPQLFKKYYDEYIKLLQESTYKLNNIEVELFAYLFNYRINVYEPFSIESPTIYNAEQDINEINLMLDEQGNYLRLVSETGVKTLITLEEKEITNQKIDISLSFFNQGSTYKAEQSNADVIKKHKIIAP